MTCVRKIPLRFGETKFTHSRACSESFAEPSLMSKKSLFESAERLVKERITGFRKGTTDVPNWTHSLRVRDTLQRYGYSEDVILAGLLHDIVEDGNTSLEELKEIGFSENVVHLVDLCSHNLSIVGSEARWMTMMARLVTANNPSAWAIKLADIIDNLHSCHTMPPEKQQFMREAKGVIMLKLTEGELGESELWRELGEAVKGV